MRVLRGFSRVGGSGYKRERKVSHDIFFQKLTTCLF
jgi:hypothetical protein